MRGLVKIHVHHAAVVHFDEVLSVVMPPVRESRNTVINARVCAVPNPELSTAWRFDRPVGLSGFAAAVKAKWRRYALHCKNCYLKGALEAEAVADRMRFHASKEDGIVDVDLKLLPKLEKSEVESRPRCVLALLRR